MEILDYYFDVRTRELPFLESPLVPGLFLCAYFSFIYFGRKYMETRERFSLKYIIGVYNIVQIILCSYVITVFRSGGFTYDYLYKCYEIDYGTNKTAMNMVYACYYTFLMKALDFCETIFFVLRKKARQISFLHVYHHVSTYVIAWFFARSIPGGTLTFPIVLNLWVHIFMYFYYFVSIFASEKRIILLKKSITTIQIIQFTIFTINVFTSIFTPNCKASTICIIFYIPSLIFYLYMFTNFYRKVYLRKAKNVKKVKSN